MASPRVGQRVAGSYHRIGRTQRADCSLGRLDSGAGLLAGCPVAPSLAGACEPVGQADERGRAGSTGD
ncbi:hypothetical protein G6F53_014306 [Rhizopus delemar]|nr:hypothetical protein G6F53_014306 [Rhizopus delemar]